LEQLKEEEGDHKEGGHKEGDREIVKQE